jgi:hypothetical protein
MHMDKFWDIFKLFKRGPQPVRLNIIAREPFQVTIEEWRSDPMKCASAKSVLQSPTVIQMMQTLQNSHPAFQVMTVADPQMRIVHQSRGEGYTMCLRDFELLAEFVKPVEAPSAEFEPEEIDRELTNAFRVPITQKTK